MVTSEIAQAQFKMKVRQEIAGATWTSGASQSRSLNLERTYLQRMLRPTNTFQTMPPSPASKRMFITSKKTLGEESRPELTTAVSHEIHEDARQLLKELPLSQIVRRGRAQTTTYRPTLGWEMVRRTRKAEANMATLKEHRMSDRLSHELWMLKCESLQKRLSLDRHHLVKYAKGHGASSAASGSKWSDAPLDDLVFWEDVLEFYKEMFEDFTSWEPGRTMAFPLNIGARARAKFPYYDPDHPEGPYESVIERTRNVLFKFPVSSVYCMVPDKTGFYRETFERALTYFDFDFEWVCPLVHGGDIYQVASDAFLGEFEHDVFVGLGDDANIIKRNNSGFIARDGANWEGQAGEILGSSFWPTKTKIGNTFQIASGVWDTSVDGTLAMMQVAGKDIPGVVEEEPEDTAVKFILGLQYAEDPVLPRTQGFKLSMDKADKGINIKIGENTSLTGKHTDRERAAWLASYKGLRLDGSPLLDGYKAVAPGDFVSGTRLRNQVISDQT